MPHWLVIDLEATTDEGGWPLVRVRPLRRPLLTPFCRN
jgi:inhibitor of KinA sporulation pathway (predicted exonuclease)